MKSVLQVFLFFTLLPVAMILISLIGQMISGSL